ncbi:hypothetical protein A176_005575 [Myxococcus hansupus]|uniref:Uncharacterized protein n=1 Tax=Pseudomyxococcus hansupus TaxID=1297742 RepID=A0A0H4X455_9BACT|nr:hypothetical protein [Myxococcus hansupus]AKQ68663.1 hypothetical protein A176_005575 [Myxococcus hansupus]
MSSIRRITASISSAISRARLDTNVESVSPLAPREPLQPVPSVRRGYADESEFQAEVDDLDTSLAAHAPKLAGVDATDAETPEHLRVFAGESSFEASPRRYSQLLGSQLPSALGAPRDAVSGGGQYRPPVRGPTAQDMGSDLLSPEAAAWELQNLDSAPPPTSMEAEDVLFMLNGPGAAVEHEAPLELGLEDIFEEAPLTASEVEAGFASAASSHRPRAQGAFFPSPDDGFAADAVDASVSNTPANHVAQAAGIDAVPADVATAAAGDARVDDAPAGFALGSAYAATYGQQFATRQALDPAVSPAGPDDFLADPLDLGLMVPDEPSVEDAAVAGVLGSIAANPAAASAPVAASFAAQGVEAVAESLSAELPPEGIPADASTVTSEPPPEH